MYTGEKYKNERLSNFCGLTYSYMPVTEREVKSEDRQCSSNHRLINTILHHLPPLGYNTDVLKTHIKGSTPNVIYITVLPMTDTREA
jgi:hypothetical protein